MHSHIWGAGIRHGVHQLTYKSPATNMHNIDMLSLTLQVSSSVFNEALGCEINMSPQHPAKLEQQGLAKAPFELHDITTPIDNVSCAALYDIIGGLRPFCLLRLVVG
eukprot:360874-Chlamydomonas_euryale.AAC.34